MSQVLEDPLTRYAKLYDVKCADTNRSIDPFAQVYAEALRLKRENQILRGRLLLEDPRIGLCQFEPGSRQGLN